MESVQGHLDQLQGKWQSFSATIADSTGLKVIIDTAGAAVTALDGLTDTFGSFAVAALPFVGIMSKAGNLGIFKIFEEFDGDHNITDGVAPFWKANEKQKGFDKELFEMDLTRQEKAINAYCASYDKAFAATKDHSEALSKARQEIEWASDATKAYCMDTDRAAISTEEFAKKQRDNFEAQQKSKKGLGGFASSSMKALGGNLLADLAIGGMLHFGSAVASWANDKWKLTSSKRIEAMETAVNDYNDAIDESKSNIGTIKSMSSEFSTLASGVDDAGRNVGLSTDQFDRYNQIVSELVKLNPSLVQSYTAEGNAIIKRNKAIQDSIDLQENSANEATRKYLYEGENIVLGAREKQKQAKSDMEKTLEKRLREDGNFFKNLAYPTLTYDMSNGGALMGDYVMDKQAPIHKAIKNFLGEEVDLQNLSLGQVEKIAEKREEILASAKYQYQADDESYAAYEKYIDAVVSGNSKLQQSSQEAAQWLQTKMFSSEDIGGEGKTVPEEFAEGYANALQKIAKSGSTDDMIAKSRKLADQLNEIDKNGELSKYTAGIKAAQKAFSDSDQGDDAIKKYNDAIGEGIEKIKGLAKAYAKTSPQIETILDEYAASLDDFANRDDLNIGDVFNAAATDIESARGVKEKFDAAMANGDYDTAIEGFEAIYQTMNDGENNAGNGSLAWWEGAEMMLGSSKLQELGYDFDKVNAAVKRLKPTMDSSAEASYNFGQMLWEAGKEGKDGGRVIKDEFGDTIAKLKKDANGGVQILDIDTDNLAAVAEKLGVSRDYLVAMVDASRQFSNVTWDDPQDIGKAINNMDTTFKSADGKEQWQFYETVQEEAKKANLSSKEFANIAKKVEQETGTHFIKMTDNAKALTKTFAKMSPEIATFTKGKGNDWAGTIDAEAFVTQMNLMGRSAEDTMKLLKRLNKDKNVEVEGLEGEGIEEYVSGKYQALNDLGINSEPIDQAVSSMERLINAMERLALAQGAIPDLTLEGDIDDTTKKVQNYQKNLSKLGESERNQVESDLGNEIDGLKTRRKSYEKVLKDNDDGILKLTQEQKKAYETALKNTKGQIETLEGVIKDLKDGELNDYEFDAEKGKYKKKANEPDGEQTSRDAIKQKIEFDVDTEKGQRELNSYIGKLDLTPKEVTTMMSAIISGQGNVDGYLDQLGVAEQDRTTVIKAIVAAAQGDIAEFDELINSLPEETQTLVEALVAYKLLSQEDPEDKDAGTNYKNESQEKPNEENAGVNYENQNQEKPDEENAGVSYKTKNQEKPKDKKAGVAYKSKNQEKPKDKKAGVAYKLKSQEKPKARNAGINYKLKSQEKPKARNAGTNYKLKSQEKPKDKKAGTNYKLKSQENPKDKDAGTHYKLKSQESPRDKTAGVTYVLKGVVGNGAVANGTPNRRKGKAPIPSMAKGGKIGPNGNGGPTLTGELGPELVWIPSKSRSFIVGALGPEIVRLPKEAVVYPADETKRILVGQGGREKFGSMSSGNGKVTGTIPNPFSGSAKRKRKGSTASQTTGNTGGTRSGKSKDSGGTDVTPKTDKKEVKKTKEIYDWIEVKLNRIQRLIDNSNKRANQTNRLHKSRLGFYDQEYKRTKREITLQEKGKKRYNKQAKKVKLPKKWKKLVDNGKIDINSVKNEKLKEKINNYKEWREKALDCRDAIVDLKGRLAEIQKEKFDAIVVKFEGKLDEKDFKANMIEEKISQTENKGRIVSTKYYENLKGTERQKISTLKQERAELQKQLNAAVKTGKIKKDSEMWREMQNEINDVSLAIEESTTKITEFDNEIREIRYDVFDRLQERISKITSESDSLIDLMSNDKLYDDKGQLTDQGMATMGLHGLNYNVYMEQADKYGRELQAVQAELNADPYNETIRARRDELLEKQRESILAAEKEKDAIADVVKEGIELELDALDKLIDKYTDALDAQKDLYDYQKKVSDQTEDIATLRKQLSAYANDDSEEAKQKIQQIKVSLEKAEEDLKDTEYDHYINAQKDLLDDLYSQYEETLNASLDDIERLVSDMIAKTNENASLISNTLKTEASNVGLKLTTEMSGIWTDAGNVLSDYHKSFVEKNTTVNGVISQINTNVANMVTALNGTATKETGNGGGNGNSGNKSGNKESNKPVKVTKIPSFESKMKGVSIGGKVVRVHKFFKIDKYSGDKKKLNKNTLKGRLRSNDFAVDNKSLAKYYKGMGFTGSFKGDGTKAQRKKMLNWLKKNGYKRGSRSIPEDQLAWTNEDTPETIVRKSDGAILTPLKAGDMVLDTAAHENIWDMASDPTKFISDHFMGTIPTATTVNNSNETNYNGDCNVHISLPNVGSYDEFVRKMQRDNNFEGLMRSMTVNQTFGGSALKKYKY